MTNETALGTAMQAMPLQDPPLAALVFHAAMGQVAHPTKLILAAIKVSGAATEVSVRRAGLGPLVDACMAHAQNQLRFFQAMGPFADVDLICRALERFHKLVRALTEDRATRKVAYGTEAGLFQGIGIPTVVCGPGHIEQAHKPNEYVALDQLAACDTFLRRLGQSL